MGLVKSLSVQYSVWEIGFQEVNSPPTLISISSLTALPYEGLSGFNG